MDEGISQINISLYSLKTSSFSQEKKERRKEGENFETKTQMKRTTKMSIQVPSYILTLLTCPIPLYSYILSSSESSLSNTEEFKSANTTASTILSSIIRQLTSIENNQSHTSYISTPLTNITNTTHHITQTNRIWNNIWRNPQRNTSTNNTISPSTSNTPTTTPSQSPTQSTSQMVDLTAETISIMRSTKNLTFLYSLLGVLLEVILKREGVQVGE